MKLKKTRPKDLDSLRRLGIEMGWIKSARNKYLHPKTDVRYGLIRSYVLHLAKEIPFLTVDDLMPPLTRHQAYSSLQQCVRHGQMIIYQKGKAGPTPRRTLFISVDNPLIFGILSPSSRAKSLRRMKGKQNERRTDTTGNMHAVGLGSQPKSRRQRAGIFRA